MGGPMHLLTWALLCVRRDGGGYARTCAGTAGVRKDGGGVQGRRVCARTAGVRKDGGGAQGRRGYALKIEIGEIF